MSGDEAMQQLREMQEQSSMDYWWPKLQATNVTVPETVWLEIVDTLEFQDGLALPVPDRDALRDAVQTVDGPPAFLRSDVTSSKHSMRGSIIPEENPTERAVAGVVEQHHLAWGMPMPSSYYVREWLDLWHLYKSFADSLTPIAAEVRVFLLDGVVHDSGFYWPENAIWEHAATEDNWRELHQTTKDKAEAGTDAVHEYASQVGEVFDTGYWSVDFALKNDGTWYAIDMARGELSFHPEGVEQARSDPRSV